MHIINIKNKSLYIISISQSEVNCQCFSTSRLRCMNMAQTSFAFAFAFNNPHFSDRRLLFQVSTSPPIICPHFEENIAMESEDVQRDHIMQVNVEDTERLHATVSEEDREILHVEVNGECSESLQVEVNEECGERLPAEIDEECGERLHLETKEEKVQGNGLIELQVNSAILASHSEYFMSLFCNGMSESSSEVVVVEVTEEERLGLISLIEYMYTGHLREPSSTEASLMLLRLADRFSIHSYMEPLVQVFKSYPKTLHECLLALGLPDSLKLNKTVCPIVENCCKYLRESFRDISSLSRRSKLLSLSMEVLKVMLGSELLDVQYEDEIFVCLSDWIKANCNDVESRVLAASELSEMVRFPWLSGDFLEDVVLESPIMQSNNRQTLMTEALRFRSCTRDRRYRLMRETTSHNRYKPRNKLILEDILGDVKTYVLRQTETSCHAHFEFPLEMVICMGKSLRSLTWTLGSDITHNFFLNATRRTMKFPYRITCVVELRCGRGHSEWNRGLCDKMYPHTGLECTMPN